MSKLSPELSCMRLDSIQHETRGGDDRYVHVTANRQMWDEETGFTPAAIALERVLWNHHLSFLKFETDNAPNTLLFLTNTASQGMDAFSLRAINEDIERVVARKPTVRIKEHSDLPGLFYAHRSERILSLAQIAITNLRSIENAHICTPSVGDKLYQPHTLMAAVVHHGFELSQAKTEVERILTT